MVPAFEEGGMRLVARGDDERNERDELGARFWLMFIGGLVAAALAGIILIGLFGRAWYAWGFFGAFTVLAVALIASGYLYDRREQKRRRGLAA
jgi:membrane protein implicated in regulation of membrane protease activity